MNTKEFDHMTDVDYFQDDRPDIWEFSRKIRDTFDHEKFEPNKAKVIGVTAPVKSGKKEIKMAVKLRTDPNATAHVYCSSFNRNDERPQRNELAAVGFYIFITQRKSGAEAFRLKVEKLANSHKIVYVHFNESDFATAEAQSLSDAFQSILHLANVRIICYSATNEELLCSEMSHVPLKFDPPPEYKGAAYYLDSGLAIEQHPFWIEKTAELTDQGKEAIELLKTSNGKYFGVVRFASHFADIVKSNKFKLAIEKCGLEVKFISSKEGPQDWSEGISKRNAEQNKKIILAINQTCTRSTEVKIHDEIAFWHDYRKGGGQYNTVTQAAGRVFHYRANDQRPHNIRVYTFLKAFELAAGRISPEDYPNQLSSRVSREELDKNKYYYVIQSYNNKPTDNEIRVQFSKAEEDYKDAIDVNFRNFKLHADKIDPTRPATSTLTNSNADSSRWDHVSMWLDHDRAPSGLVPNAVVILHLDGPAKHFHESWKKHVVANGYENQYLALVRVPRKTDRKKIMSAPKAQNTMFKKFSHDN